MSILDAPLMLISLLQNQSNHKERQMDIFVSISRSTPNFGSEPHYKIFSYRELWDISDRFVGSFCIPFGIWMGTEFAGPVEE